MLKNLLRVGMTLGVLSIGISFAHAEPSALEQLQQANNGKQDTGTHFRWSGANSAREPLILP